MEDSDIIKNLFDRNEDALSFIEKKYGGLMKSMAGNILDSKEDCEECVNESLLKLWNSIPPARPDNLPAYIAKTARNMALDMTRAMNAEKRKADRLSESYEELSEALHSDFDVEKEYDRHEVERIIKEFLETLSTEERMVFVGRYFFFDTYEKICRQTGLSQKKVRYLAKKTAGRLAAVLEKEGYNGY